MKYVIAINNSFNKSFLSEYGFETTLDNLENKFHDWQLMNESAKETKIRKIRDFVNITNTDGLKDVYEDLILANRNIEDKQKINFNEAFVYDLDKVNIFKFLFLKIFRYEIFSWKQSAKYKKSKNMFFPPSSEWFNVRKKQKKKLIII